MYDLFVCETNLDIIELSVHCLRGAVPPGARFDPFGPVPPRGSRTDPRSGRFAG